MASEAKQTDIKMNADSLYQEETFTDRRVGTIQRLTPVTSSGSRDDTRPVVFLGQTQILTPAGALPLNFEVDADSLEDAIEKFGDGAKGAVSEAMERLEEMRREAASSIIVPGSNPPPGAGGSPPSGGIKLS